METCRVDDLFAVSYGVNLELNALVQDPGGINFVSRSSKNNGVSAKVRPLPYVEPIPAGTITVAGGGSVMEAFLQSTPYYSGRDLYYLTARRPMSSEEKLYYCMCLRGNKYKFSYGRQANVTLHALPIPAYESIPDYVKGFSARQYGLELLQQANFAMEPANYPKLRRLIPLESLFRVENGISSSQVLRAKTRTSENWIPFIRPSYRQETSFCAYVNKKLVPQEKIFPPQTLYVSTNGQGSHTFSYVSTTEFVPNSDVMVLIPHRPMSLQEKLFYAQCITGNRHRFSYGRKPKGERIKRVLLPEYPPDYVVQYDMNQLAHSLGAVLDRL